MSELLSVSAGGGGEPGSHDGPATGDPGAVTSPTQGAHVTQPPAAAEVRAPSVSGAPVLGDGPFNLILEARGQTWTFIGLARGEPYAMAQDCQPIGDGGPETHSDIPPDCAAGGTPSSARVEEPDLRRDADDGAAGDAPTATEVPEAQ